MKRSGEGCEMGGLSGMAELALLTKLTELVARGMGWTRLDCRGVIHA